MISQNDKRGLDEVLQGFLQGYNFNTNVDLEKKLWSEISGEYQKAEKLIKRLEQETFGEDNSKGLCYLSVEDLKNAGSFFADAMVEQNQTERLKKLCHALCYCLRSSSNTYYVAIWYLFYKCKNFQDDYNDISITDNEVKDYVSKKLKLDEIRKSNLVNEDPSTSAVSSVQEMKDKLQTRERNYKDVKDIYDSFESGRDELNKKLREKRRQRVYYWVGIVVTIVCTILKMVF